MPPRPTSQSYGRGGRLGAESRVASGSPGAESIHRAERDIHARRILINSATPLTQYSLLEIHDDTGTLDADIALIQAGDISFPTGAAATYNMMASRGTIGAPIAVAADDGLGLIYWKGWNGTSYQPVSLVFGDVKGVSGGIVSGRWTLYVHPRNGSVLLGAIQVTADTTADDSLIINLAPNAGDTVNIHGVPMDPRFSKAKTGDVTITSGGIGTTLTDDPDLQTTLPVGRYAFHMRVMATAESVNPDIKWDFAGSATYNGNYSYSSLTGTTRTQGAIVTNYATDQSLVMTAALYEINLDGVVEVTVAGTFIFRWAQNSSSVDDLTVHENSWMTLVPLG